MCHTLPTVKPLIEALQLADLTVRRPFRVVGAYCLGPSRTEDLGFPDWAQSPTPPPRLVRRRLAHGPASAGPGRRHLGGVAAALLLA